MRYWVFIGYSHRDKIWGDWLHKSLESYRVPSPLVGKPTTRGESVPERIYPVFRDREELPTAVDLGEIINTALDQSRYLVVICSPNSAKSQWVNQEIINFKRLGRENRVLAIIVEGEPNAAEGKPGFAAEDECFPPALKYKIGSDGYLTDERTEPIAADAWPHADGKNNALLNVKAMSFDASLIAVSVDIGGTEGIRILRLHDGEILAKRPGVRASGRPHQRACFC